MKVALKTWAHLGDNILLTAVLENLKKAYPQVDFTIQVSQQYKGLFEDNPNVVWFDPAEADIRIHCSYKSFDQHTASGGNLIVGFTLHTFKFMQPYRASTPVLQCQTPKFYFELEDNKYGDYYVINANCQKLTQRKLYPYYQYIIDSRPDLKFVQIGGNQDRDETQQLNGIVDIRGQTSVKSLVSVVAHSKGVICPPTGIVHIAAAFPEVKQIVLTGGTQPVKLIDYPGTMHMTAKCEQGWGITCGCLKKVVNVPGHPANCDHTTIINNRRYVNCMCRIDPMEISRLL